MTPLGKQESLDKEDDYIEVGSAHLNTTVSAPTEQPGAKRKEEMKLLYGKHASEVMALEASLQLNFDKNYTIENYELEDYIAEILFGEFNTMADDGSLPKVVEKLCRYHGLWKEGKTQQIQQEISSTPKTKLPQFAKQETGRDVSDASDGDSGSETEEETNRDVYCNGHHEDSRSSNVTVSQTLDQLHISENGTNEQLNNSETENTEPSSRYLQLPTNEEGWEIVRRSKRR
ncbi:Pre-rRNA-processing protein TSR2-like protein [Acropora cervicornis]|uniref:Pre-rRNA-processing protein TSR2-like protein n=1 Tax=Acropora cervicornis TaxID=6130 RepID=A0AAD9V6J0_ACRCE|nr:Pre-rRNA-processing protein TSR2-like protein [Acropora cervicornis]